MFKIVLFLEESDEAWSTPLKIGFMFLNRLVIDEEAAFEIIGRVLGTTRSKHSITLSMDYRIVTLMLMISLRSKFVHKHL